MTSASWLLLQQTPTDVFTTCAGLLLLKAPGTVPIFRGRVQDQSIKPLDEGDRGAIIGHHSECSLKGATRFAPLSTPVAGKSFRIMISQLELRGREFAPARHNLEHRLRPVLPQYCDAVDLARLHGVRGCSEGRLRHQNAAAIFLVGTLQARREIDRV